LYFYVRGTLEDKYALSKKDIVHFIPAVVALIGTTPYIFKSFDKKLAIAKQIVNDVNSINQIDVNLFYNIGGSFAFRSILGFGYILFCFFIIWKKHPSKIENLLVPKKQFYITYRWLLILVSSLFIITISLTVTAIKPTVLTVKENFLKDGDVFYQITGIAYFVLTISLLLFPEILYGMPRKIAQPTTKKKKTISKLKSDEDPFIDVNESIIEYLNTKKPYLNPDFNISDIAFELKIPQNHVSYCISNIMNTRFSKLKSELRIQHAIELLKGGHNSSITIDGIGIQSGFNTRSNFYSSFKTITGYTPSEYYKLNKNIE
jgi:AraC-like DNA-binding protein